MIRSHAMQVHVNWSCTPKFMQWHTQMSESAHFFCKRRISTIVFSFNISPLTGFVYNIPAIHTKSTDAFSYCLEEPQQKLSSLNWHMLLCGINPNNDWYVLFCHFLYSTFQADCDLCCHCQCLSTSVCVSRCVSFLWGRVNLPWLIHTCWDERQPCPHNLSQTVMLKPAV